MKKQWKTEPIPYKLLLILFSVWVVLSVYMLVSTSGNADLLNSRPDLTEVNNLWSQDRTGKLIKPVQLPFQDTLPTGSSVELSWDPGLVAADQQLILHTSHTAIKVYCQDELIDSFGYPQIGATFVTSPGEAWHMIRLPQPYPGRVVIHLTSVFADEGVMLDSAFLGSPLSLIHYLWSGYGMELLFSLIMLLLGLASCVIPFTQHNGRQLYGCLFLGLFSAIAGLWQLLGNPLLQFFLEDSSSKVYLARWLLMLAMPIPFLAYMHLFYTSPGKAPVFLMLSAHVLVILVSCALQSIGIVDFHRLRGIYYTAFILSFLVVTYVLMRDFIKKKEIRTLSLLIGVGVLGLGCLLMTLEINLFHWVYSDPLFYSVMLGFIILLFALSIQMVNRVEEFRPTNELLDLVFKDPVTHVRNRAAYEDVVSMYRGKMEESGLGLIMVDINHLKSVNDTLGHQAGDQYLFDCCKVICESFENYDVYRVGGDEFVVLLRQCSPQRVEMLLKKLRENIRAYEESHGDTLSMAAGYSFASLGDRSLEDVFLRADREMYRDKRAQQQIGWTWRKDGKPSESGYTERTNEDENRNMHGDDERVNSKAIGL